MDLKTFVSQSLSQILDGVRQAQQSPGGEHVAAQGWIDPKDGLMYSGDSGVFTRVDFDVSVFAETKDGEPSVQVGDINAVAAGSTTNQNASRVKFSVHVRLPIGGPDLASQGEDSFNRRITYPDD
jgi:hypothetical protein